MLTLSIFDIPLLANIKRTVSSSFPIPPIINDYLYDMSGSVYLSGSYDRFISYDDGTCPGNAGYGWNGPWVCQPRITYKLMSADVLLEYSSSFIYEEGTSVSGSDYGYGWETPWNVIEGV
jgi:hypothetical protein